MLRLFRRVCKQIGGNGFLYVKLFVGSVEFSHFLCSFLLAFLNQALYSGAVVLYNFLITLLLVIVSVIISIGRSVLYFSLFIIIVFSCSLSFSIYLYLFVLILHALRRLLKVLLNYFQFSSVYYLIWFFIFFCYDNQ